MGKYHIVMHDSELGMDHQIADRIVRGGPTTPFDLLLYAVASCNVLVFKNLLEVNRLSFDFDRVECLGETENNTAKWLEVLLYVKVDPADQAKVDKLATQISKFCTVVKALDPALEVKKKVVYL